MTRRSPSAPNSRKAALSSAMSVSLNALRSAGRLSQTSATWGDGRRISNVVGALLLIGSASHAEEAETRRLGYRRVEAGAQAQCQHAAGVRRVDHAVVPQAGTGVVRMCLVAELVEDRLLER